MKVFETDWLASNPVFYNERTKSVSYNINDVIDYKNMEFHPEGLRNYLEFGYSVFEQTPIDNVKFLRHSSRLTVENEKINVEYLEDPVEKWVGIQTSEEEVLDLLRNKIQKWESEVSGEVIVPTSGGYDSRLLNLMIKDKSRIRSFSYGISDNQSKSREVVYAKKLSEVLGTKWDQIELGQFHTYLDDWDNMFGVSTHAHGMYHMEFYKKILQRVSGGNPLLSGIVGDAWAGSIKFQNIRTASDLIYLGYSHGVYADKDQLVINAGNELKNTYFELNKDKINDPLYQVITIIRFKMILLCYLLKVPASYGLKPWSPFLDIDLVMRMISLPPDRRSNRLWQKDYFKKMGVDFDDMHIKSTTVNTLDLQALKTIRLRPLDDGLLEDIIKPSYIRWINSKVCDDSFLTQIGNMTIDTPAGILLKRLGVKDERLKAYNAYITIKPIENVVRKKISICNGKNTL